MSAALVDEFGFDGFALRAVPAQRTASRALEPVRPSAPVRRQAPCDHGVPIVAGARPGWRLTERGIAVVLAVFIGLFVAGAAVVISSFLAVSDAPVASAAAAPAVVGVVGG